MNIKKALAQSRIKASAVATQGGKVFWVDSTNTAGGANAPGYGLTPDKPFLSIDYAIGNCTADSGFVIKAMPGHAEAVATAAGLVCDIAGITIEGLGSGDARPTITFGSVAGADCDIDAARVTFKNVVFVNDIDSQTIMIDVNATDFTLLDCEFRTGHLGLNQPEIYIDLSGANACDRFRMIGCRVKSTAAGSNQFIKFTATQDSCEIRNNWISGDFAVAAIWSDQVCTNILIADNYIHQLNTGDFCIEFTDATTGMCVNNRLYADAIATVLDPGSMKCAGNIASVTIDDPGQIVPVGTGDLEDVGNALYGSAGVVSWPVGAAPANGVSIAEGLRWLDDAVQGATGVVTFPAAAAPANGVSLAEVLRAIYNAVSHDSAASSVAVQSGLGRLVTKTQDLASDPDNLFDVTGQVAITMLIGEVTTVIGTTTTLLLELATGVALCAATTITTDADGTMYLLNGDAGSILNGVDAPVVGVAHTSGTPHAPIIVGEAGGTNVIRAQLDGAGTGAILWRMFYIPLEANAAVVAAA